MIMGPVAVLAVLVAYALLRGLVGKLPLSPQEREVHEATHEP